MNAEHLLDAMGLLDDELVQEAERYVRKKSQVNYRQWLGLAAAFAIVVTLGYGVTHVRMGGSSTAPGYAGGTAGGNTAGEPSASLGDTLPFEGDESDPCQSGESPETVDPECPGSPVGEEPQGDWLFALKADGTVYWATEEYLDLEPEEGDIRYTTSFINSAEPEEDGQANFLPVGSAYVVLDNGTAAVYQEDTGSWRVYDSVLPWEK